MDRQFWSPCRQKAAIVFESRRFDIVMGAIIVFNVSLMVTEADASSSCTDEYSLCTPEWLGILNYVLLGIYTVELVGRICVFRKSFFASRWNLIDAAIVIVAYVEVILSTAAKVPGMHLVRIFRLGRLARLFRVLKVFPVLYSMVRGFASTMSTIIWGFFLILGLLLVWSLLTVELVHPRNKSLYAETGGDTSEWCYVAFSTVGNSILYYFQTLVAGDSWGACAIPLMKEYHETFWIFTLAYITVQLGFTNLVLAVIVDAAAKARDEDLHQRILAKKKQEKEATERLLTVIQRMDTDGSKTISWEELKTSFETDTEVQDLMAMLNIDEKDLHRMFDFMDSNKDGSVDYMEFVEAISKAGDQDMRVQLMMMKLHISEISRSCERTLEALTGSLRGTPGGPGLQLHVPMRPSVTMRPSGSRASSLAPQKLRMAAGDSQPAGEGEGSGAGLQGAESNEPREVVAALEQELSLLGINLGERLEALAQEAADQVSTLAKQTRSLSAALVSAGSECHPPPPPRSQWSRVKESRATEPRPELLRPELLRSAYSSSRSSLEGGQEASGNRPKTPSSTGRSRSSLPDVPSTSRGSTDSFTAHSNQRRPPGRGQPRAVSWSVAGGAR